MALRFTDPEGQEWEVAELFARDGLKPQSDAHHRIDRLRPLDDPAIEIIEGIPMRRVQAGDPAPRKRSPEDERRYRALVEMRTKAYREHHEL